MMTSVPFPSSELTSMVPPFISTISRLMIRPTPAPRSLPVPGMERTRARSKSESRTPGDIPVPESTTLIRNGVFGITRNPMYLGMVFVLLGEALILGSLTPFAVVVALLILFDRVFIRREECILEDTFGDVFKEYRNRVRRWV